MSIVLITLLPRLRAQRLIVKIITQTYRIKTTTDKGVYILFRRLNFLG